MSARQEGEVSHLRTRRALPIAIPIVLAGLGMFGPFSIDTPMPAFSSMGEDFGVGSTAMQQVISVYLLAYATMSIFHGPISDAIGRKPILIGGALLYALASVGAALSPSLELLLACRAVQGLSAGAGTIISRAMVRDLYEGQQAQKMMSTIAMLFGVAPAVAPVIGGWLLAFGRWPLIFWFLCGFGLVIALAVAALLPESLPSDQRRPLRVRPMLAGLLEVGRHRSFQRIAAANALSLSAQFLYISSAPMFVVHLLGLGEQDFWVFFVPMISGMVLGAFVHGRLAGRLHGFALVHIGQGVAIVAAVANVTFSLLEGTRAELPWAVIGPAGIGFGTGMAMPIFQLSMLDLFPGLRGSAASMSTVTMLMLNAVLAGVIAPLVAQDITTLALTSLVLLIAGQSMWHWHRVSLRSRSARPEATSPVVAGSPTGGDG